LRLSELDFLSSAILVGILVFLFRHTERWMHQHIFKVGWLLTRNMHLTTILYYIVFLPGVVLYEVTYWLAAGVLNVRANRSIRLPKPQEIGRLELSFVKLAPKAHPVKRSIIASAPLAVGLLVIWAIALNAFELEAVLNIAAPGQLDDLAQAIADLVARTDFWLWFYLAFTVSNTMFPAIPKSLRGWRLAGIATLLIIITALVLGISQTFVADMGGTVQQLWHGLALILSLTTLINIFMVIVLGTIEAIIERLTGHSATFQNGKLITMTRQQALQRKDEARRERRPAPKITAAAVNSMDTLKLPIPGPPGQEPVSKSVAAILDAPAPKQKPGDKMNRPTRGAGAKPASQPPLVISAAKGNDTRKPKEKRSAKPPSSSSGYSEDDELTYEPIEDEYYDDAF